MVSARSPPWKKQTPTNNPEFLGIWRNWYRELHIEGKMGKSEALETIGKYYGVSRQTVMYHLFPQYKKYQKNFGGKKWAYEKRNPKIHRRLMTYKAKYQATRYHIDDLIRQSYERFPPKKEMTLEELSDTIHDISGISFHPDTIHGLVNRIESKKDCRLLVEVHGYDPPKYRFTEKDAYK